eukprot:SAG11_NODE_28786_length_318_cov_0.474886_1_plen_33_part_10
MQLSASRASANDTHIAAIGLGVDAGERCGLCRR